MRQILVVCETAICVVLVIGAGLLVESFLVSPASGLRIPRTRDSDGQHLDAYRRCGGTYTGRPEAEAEKIWQAAMVSFNER